MMTYLYTTVWPGVPADRQKLLRTVLHGPPFRIRTPEDLLLNGARLGTTVLTYVDAELKKRGQAMLTPAERAMYLHYVETQCSASTSAETSIFETPSSVYKPAEKKRFVEG
jgi:hypothetical protein